MQRTMTRLVLVLSMGLGGVGGVLGDNACGQDLPPYPQQDSAGQYRVDDKWPVRPAGIEWGAVSGIAVDEGGEIWVFTRANPPVQVYTAEGKLVRSWGADLIKSAHHLKIERDGTVWVADIGNHLVMQFTKEGKLLREIGVRGDKGDDERRLNMPTDMCVTASGEVFISDGYGNNRVVHVDKRGMFVKSWGKMGRKPGEFSLPHAIAMDAKGKLYVADRNNCRIQVFDQDGKLLDVWNNLLTPWGFWVTKEDDIWVCGSSPMSWKEAGIDSPLGCPPKDQLIMRFNTNGKLLELHTFPKATDGLEKPGELNWVHCLAFDAKRNLYMGDIIGKRAQKFVYVPAVAP